MPISLLNQGNTIKALVELDENQLASWDPINNDLTPIPLTNCQQATLMRAYVVDRRWGVTEHDNFREPECEIFGSALWDLSVSPPQEMWFMPEAMLSEISISPVINSNGSLIAGSTQTLSPENELLLEDLDAILPDDLPFSSVMVWDRTSEETFFLPHEIDFSEYIAVHPTESLIATVDHAEQFHSVFLWDLNSASEPISTKLPINDVMIGGTWMEKLAFTPSGQKLFATYGDQSLRIWDVAESGIECRTHINLKLSLCRGGRTCSRVCRITNPPSGIVECLIH